MFRVWGFWGCGVLGCRIYDLGFRRLRALGFWASCRKSARRMQGSLLELLHLCSYVKAWGRNLKGTYRRPGHSTP